MVKSIDMPSMHGSQLRLQGIKPKRVWCRASQVRYQLPCGTVWLEHCQEGCRQVAV